MQVNVAILPLEAKIVVHLSLVLVATVFLGGKLILVPRLLFAVRSLTPISFPLTSQGRLVSKCSQGSFSTGGMPKDMVCCITPPAFHCDRLGGSWVNIGMG